MFAGEDLTVVAIFVVGSMGIIRANFVRRAPMERDRSGGMFMFCRADVYMRKRD